LEQKTRIITESTHFVSLVPFWAMWPFETYIIPKRHVRYVSELSAEEQEDLATVMRILLIK